MSIDPNVYTDYAAAKKFLSRSRSGYDRPLSKNCRIHWEGDDSIAIQLHATNIITLHANGDTTFCTNGWTTPTTSSYMRNNTRFTVSSYRAPDWAGGNMWTVRPNRGRPAYPPNPANGDYGSPEHHAAHDEWIAAMREWDRKAYVFVDGITFTRRGRLVARTPVFETVEQRIERLRPAHEAEVAAMRKRNGKILSYLNKVEKSFSNGMAADPLDCPACRLGISDHLSLHVEASEVPSALIIAALTNQGEGDLREVLGLRYVANELVMGGPIPSTKLELHHGNPSYVRTIVDEAIRPVLVDCL